MGKIIGGILGNFSGKVGNVVGGSWKGIGTLRAYNPVVSNPRTNAQVNNRDRFSIITAMASDLLSTVIKPCWDRFAVQMSGYNYFCSVNRNCIDGAKEFSFGDFKLTTGKMLSITSLAHSMVGSDHKFSFSTACTDKFQQPTDLLFYAVIDDKGVVVTSGGGTIARSVGSLTVKAADIDGYAVGTLAIFVSFMRTDGSVVDSSCMGSFV